MNGTELSNEFKDLVLGLFNYDPESRMTLDQVRAHPWLQAETFNFEAVRAEMLVTLAQKQLNKPALETDRPMTRPVKVKRTAPMV